MQWDKKRYLQIERNRKSVTSNFQSTYRHVSQAKPLTVVVLTLPPPSLLPLSSKLPPAAVAAAPAALSDRMPPVGIVETLDRGRFWHPEQSTLCTGVIFFFKTLCITQAHYWLADDLY